MVSKPTQLKWVFPILAILLIGCSPGSQPESGPTASATNCQSRRESEIGFTSLGLKNGPAANAQVAALIFTRDDNGLLIAYGFDQPDTVGQLVQVDLSDNHLRSQVAVGRLTPGLAHFTEGSGLIIGAAQKSCADELRASDTCWDVWAWSTATGRSRGWPAGFNTNLRDIAVSGDSKWLLKAMLVSTITSFDQPAHGESFAENLEGVHREVVAGALSEHGNWVALGIRDEEYESRKWVRGLIRLKQWDGNSMQSVRLADFGLLHSIPFEPEIDGTPLRLAFDPQDRWLAAQSEKSIYLFNLPSMALREKTDIPSATLAVVRFNPSGSLLAVGHGEGLTVLHVPDLKIVHAVKGAAVSAVAFSPHGCLLAWGDMEGTVHITSAPQP